MLRLRPSEPADIDLFYRMQQDPQAVWMAAFTSANLGDRAAFEARWQRILADHTALARTIVLAQQPSYEEAIGQAMSWLSQGHPEVSYWLARDHWGRGYATAALELLLGEIPARPVFARVAADNERSLRVLRRNGFAVVDQEISMSEGRHELVREYVLRLGA